PTNLNNPGFPVTDTSPLKFMMFLLIFNNFNSYYSVTLTDVVNYVNILYYLSKTSMIAVKMSGVITAMTDEKLRTTGITSCVSHRKHSTVMILIITFQFTIYFISWTTCSWHTRRALTCIGTTSLNYKIRKYSVEI